MSGSKKLWLGIIAAGVAMAALARRLVGRDGASGRESQPEAGPPASDLSGADAG